jgi:hypothetical protein
VRLARRARLDQITEDVMLQKQAEVAAEFDAIHTVERAKDVGSLDDILGPRQLRRSLIRYLSD